MKLLNGSQLAQELCGVLGINADNVCGITVNCEAGRPAEVTVKHIVKEEAAGRLKDTFRRYILIEAKGDR